MLQNAGVLYILTCKCASCHRFVRFLGIWSSKVARECGVLQVLTWKCASRLAIFPDRNFQNRSLAEVFCTFWLENVLRATAACNFSGSELPKLVPRWSVWNILTYKCASRHSGVPFFISLLNSYLRTRRFSEDPFRTSATTNHWENTAIRDFPNIWRMSIFFLVTLLVCWSSFCWLDCSTLLFNCPYCRKLDFETSFDKAIYTGYNFN